MDLPITQSLMGHLLTADIRRFWAKVDVCGPDECWVWTGRRDPNGYGRFDAGSRPLRRALLAHRVAYAAVVQSPGLFCVLHTCDNPPCCNPAHLRAGTKRENSQDMVSRGRQSCGERHPSSRVTAQQVRAIRRRVALGETQASLAREMQVHVMTVNDVVHHRTWRNLGPS